MLVLELLELGLRLEHLNSLEQLVMVDLPVSCQVDGSFSDVIELLTLR
jgi:hypothetical protein